MDEKAIKELCEAHPYYIPVEVAAQFLHIKPAALRAAIEQGHCPFGLCWRLGTKRGYKIPTITFVAWLTNGNTYMAAS